MKRRQKTERFRRRRGVRTLQAYAVALLAVVSLGAKAAADMAAVRVAGRYNARVAHVETIGTLFNQQQDVGGGSGLLIGNALVLTNNHVIPLENNYKRLDIFVRLKSRLANPIAVTAFHRDPERDLALLELATAASTDAGGERCPMPVVVQEALAPMGSNIYVLGYPLNQDLSLSGGLISNHGGTDGRWQTDTVMNPGNSGGPVFEEHGALVGIAVGGIVKWSYGGETHNVNGVNFFIPVSTIMVSPLFRTISDVPFDRRCWVEADSAFMTAAITSAAAASVPGPPHINRAYTFSQTNYGHPTALASQPRPYDKRFQAEPGYQIAACNWLDESSNHASDVACNIGADRASASFTFRLDSGGWLAGTLTLSQDLQN